MTFNPSASRIISLAIIGRLKNSATAWNSTKELYQRTRENYPDNVEVRVNLAALYLQRQQYKGAENHITSIRQSEEQLADF